MPIHIIRDVALTIRSFYKRITDFVRYRQATRDMNARYPDATADEIAREDVCIICREDIRPWEPATQDNPPNTNPENNPQPSITSPDERLRPKKLPCGHVLHFACLRSWLERQQICPTCRRPVLVSENVSSAQVRSNTQPRHVQGQAAPGPNPAPQQNVYQFGPLRIAFGVRNIAPRQAQPQPQQQPLPPRQQPLFPMPEATAHRQNANGPVAGQSQSRNPFNPQPPQPPPANLSPATISSQLLQIEHQLAREINELSISSDQLQTVRALQSELLRLRLLQFSTSHGGARSPTNNTSSQLTSMRTHQPSGLVFAADQSPETGGNAPGTLPPGMTLPDGWSVLPLRQLSQTPTTAFIAMTDAQSQASNMAGSGHATTSPSAGLSAPPANILPTGQASSVRPSAGGTANAPFGPTQSDSPSSHAAIQSKPVNTQGTSAAPTLQSPPHSAVASPPLQDLPQWGSQATTSNHREPDKGNSNDKAAERDWELVGDKDSEQRRPGSNDKGKGRATTVEDSNEDMD